MDQKAARYVIVVNCKAHSMPLQNALCRTRTSAVLLRCRRDAPNAPIDAVVVAATVDPAAQGLRPSFLSRNRLLLIEPLQVSTGTEVSAIVGV